MTISANFMVRAALLGAMLMASGCALGVDEALVDSNEHLAAALDNARDNGNRGNGNIPGGGGQNGNEGGNTANNGGTTGGGTAGGGGPTTTGGPSENGNGGKHANAGGGNGSELDGNGDDMDPGRSGGKNKGGD